MRTILTLVAGAILLAACATPTMTAMRGGSTAPVGANARDEEPPVPPALRRPQLTVRGWGTIGSGGMY